MELGREQGGSTLVLPAEIRMLRRYGRLFPGSRRIFYAECRSLCRETVFGDGSAQSSMERRMDEP